MTDRERAEHIDKYIDEALYDRFDYIARAKWKMKRSPWVSLQRALSLAPTKLIAQIISQISYFLHTGYLGEAEENQIAMERYLFHNPEINGDMNYSQEFLSRAGHIER